MIGLSVGHRRALVEPELAVVLGPFSGDEVTGAELAFDHTAGEQFGRLLHGDVPSDSARYTERTCLHAALNHRVCGKFEVGVANNATGHESGESGVVGEVQIAIDPGAYA